VAAARKVVVARVAAAGAVAPAAARADGNSSRVPRERGTR
jgi:hypothetical protein